MAKSEKKISIASLDKVLKNKQWILQQNSGLVMR